MNDIKLLQFTNPVFRKGFNLTVRKGTKWHNVEECRVELGGGYTKYVNRLETHVMNFNELTDADLVYEHDPSCRTVEGLLKELKRVYPDFAENDEVTLITFYLTGRAPTIGDKIYVADMVPIDVSKIESVIDLDNSFWEITAVNPSIRFIVHESHWDRTLGEWSNANNVPPQSGGWFYQPQKV